MINLKLAKNLQNLEKLLFFLTVLLLPTQLGKHFWPPFSSIYSLRIDYLSPTVYFWDLLVLLLLLISFLSWFFNKKPDTNVNLKAAIILLFFLFTQLTSVFSADNPGAALIRGKEYLFASLFGLYIASAKIANIKKILRIALLAAVVFSCFLGIAQFLTGSSLGFWVLGERSFSVATPLVSKFNFYDRIFLRPYATFSHPNMLAGFLLVTLPLLLSIPSKSLWAFKIMLSFLISSTVFITFSRPGLILISIYLAVLFKRLWKFLAILAVLTAPLIVVRFASIFTFDTLAVLRREQLSNFAFRLFLENPFFGVGLNNFINSLASSEVLVGTSRFLQPVHNIFLLSLSETGIIGLSGFLAMLGTALIINLKRNLLFNKALCASMLIMIFLGLFDHYFLTLPQGQRLLFMIVGLSLMDIKEIKT